MRSQRVTVSWNCSSRSRPSRICSRLTRAGNRTAVLIGLSTIERAFGMSRPFDLLVDARFRKTWRVSASRWLSALVVPGVLLMACAPKVRRQRSRWKSAARQPSPGYGIHVECAIDVGTAITVPSPGSATLTVITSPSHTISVPFGADAIYLYDQDDRQRAEFLRP